MEKRSAANIFTIGHSNHTWETFAHLLAAAKIQTLADVRSYPRSRFSHFNQVPLTARLAALDITYLYFGDKLGGRPQVANTLDYEAIARTPSYIDALMRIEDIATRQRMALMCSEHEPLACHRCLLLGRSLAERGLAVGHILRDGCIELHEDTEARLLALTKKKIGDLFVTPSERLAQAYLVQVQALHRKPK